MEKIIRTCQNSSNIGAACLEKLCKYLYDKMAWNGAFPKQIQAENLKNP